MSQHLAMRSANPALGADTFRGTRVVRGEEAMTIGGTVGKTALALLLVVAAAAYIWGLGVGDPRVGLLTAVGLFGGLIAAVATIARPAWAPVTTPLYAVLEGLALGGISLGFEARYPGLVGQAVFATFGTLGALLAAYGGGLVRVTDKLRLGIFAATGGIAVVYVAGFVMSLFGAQMPLVHGSGTVGILFSVVVVGVAALNLVLDFDFIEQGAERGAPKYMEWYGAFGLLVTLVWLYLEMLRLLAKLQERR
jgi:uncharacterized YccA/Bax inhibitor family protein